MEKGRLHCPQCGGHSVENGHVVVTNQNCHARSWCFDCGSSWNNIFKFSHHSELETPKETFQRYGKTIEVTRFALRGVINA